VCVLLGFVAGSLTTLAVLGVATYAWVVHMSRSA